MQAFTWTRRIPLNVLTLDAGVPLVQTGGKNLNLREDWFDNARNVAGRHPLAGGCEIDSPYDIALSGGEPFAVWR